MRTLLPISLRPGALLAVALLAFATSILPTLAQDACSNRGQLDTLYCDQDNDLVADTPKDPAKWKDPSTLIFSYAPVENPAVYQIVYQPLLDRIASCTGKKVSYYSAQSSTAQIEAMRSGRLHISSYSTGAVGFAVNMAGAVPFVVMGSENGVAGYRVQAIVRADSPHKTLTDLKGKKIAHVAPSSNSGHLAPKVMFPDQGLTPDVDYKPLMSGGHDKSIIGVASGDYDMAPVASDILDRMLARGDVKSDALRIIWKSDVFPTLNVTYAHDLKPELQATLRKCFEDFRFPDSMKKEYQGFDRFLPMTYKDTWKPLRDVAEKSGTPYNKAAYEAQQKRDADAAAKKAAEQPVEKKTP
jgi:phosphonate transport system substrate-binding protein